MTEKPEPFYLGCFPVDLAARQRLIARGKDLNLPGLPAVRPGSEQRPCSKCGQAVWVGPMQLDVMAKSPEYVPLCVTCLATEMGSADRPLTFRNLGNFETDWDRGD